MLMFLAPRVRSRFCGNYPPSKKAKVQAARAADRATIVAGLQSQAAQGCAMKFSMWGAIAVVGVLAYNKPVRVARQEAETVKGRQLKYKRTLVLVNQAGTASAGRRFGMSLPVDWC